jgi:hypothetical protein
MRYFETGISCLRIVLKPVQSLTRCRLSCRLPGISEKIVCLYASFCCLHRHVFMTFSGFSHFLVTVVQAVLRNTQIFRSTQLHSYMRQSGDRITTRMRNKSFDKEEYAHKNTLLLFL